MRTNKQNQHVPVWVAVLSIGTAAVALFCAIVIGLSIVRAPIALPVQKLVSFVRLPHDTASYALISESGAVKK